MIEHPDVTAAQRDGYPSWTNTENQNNAENRRTFTEEHIKDFIDWVLASDPDAIDEFVEDHNHLYIKWLN